MPEQCPHHPQGKKIQKSCGPHLGEYCECGTWLRWVPKNILDFIWPIGSKHKGKTLKEILHTDRRYLEWAAQNVSGKLAEKAQEALRSQRSQNIKPVQTELFPKDLQEKTTPHPNDEDLPWDD